ncbi:MAG: hypothetical protein AUF79_16775 [Crenarchaeota archaeon 13_1_20CM_2_51_8]|nr:MAG: hypothetical protein AUF79_16775 [Crenarchaeota archaeon 13_1_20CM_2_51_8]
MDFRLVYNKYFRHARSYEGYLWDLNCGPIGGFEETFYDAIILRRSEGLFIDAGACYGAWAMRASRYYSTTIAFEPHDQTYSLLKRNLQINKIKNVIALNLALSDRAGESSIYLYPSPGTHSIYSEHLGLKSTNQTQTVQTSKLDDYSFKQPVSMIKVDTEGAELEVLRGAMKTIRKYKPRLAIETHFPDHSGKIRLMLPQYNWKSLSQYLWSESPDDGSTGSFH